MSRLWRRIVCLVRRRPLERELDEEMRVHLEMKAQELGDADRARRAFGSPTLLREESREAWGWAWLDALARDVRFGLRMLRKDPRFTLVAVLTLALGVGANTAMFSVVNALLLRPLPYYEPERLIALDLHARSHDGAPRRGPSKLPWSYPRFQDLRRFSSCFERIAAVVSKQVNLTGTGHPERLSAELVSAEYFSLLGVEAAAGRVFLPEEDRAPGDAAVALLSDGLWRRRFGGDPRVIGGTVHVDRIPLTVVGIMPQGFRGVTGAAELWAPMQAAPALYGTPKRLADSNANSFWHQAIARLRPGVTRGQAAEQLRGLAPLMEQAHPAPRSMALEPASAGLLEAKIDPAIRRSVLILFGAVGFVLLIACANLANLLLGRAVGRQREVTIRLALGAPRAAIVRQWLVETVLLSLLGAAAGLALAAWSLTLVAGLRPETTRGFWQNYARLLDREAIRLDHTVLVFNFVVAGVAGLLFGLLPARRAARSELEAGLRGAAPRRPRVWGRFSSRNVLVAAEFALALVLLAGAGLMVRSFAGMLQTPLGFEAGPTLTFRVELPRQQAEGTKPAALFEQLLMRLSTLPGVEAAALANSLPVSGQREGTVVGIDQHERIDPVAVHMVAPEYFRLLRVPLRSGRLPDERDRPGAPLAVVINESGARRLFPGQDPLGRRVTGVTGDSSAAEIVGIVGDVKYEETEKAVETDVYVSFRQHCYGSTYVLVRAAGDPTALTAAVRHEVLALDRDLPIYDVRTMRQRVAQATSRTRFSAALLGGFAALALLLAAIGIYGVAACSVAARTRELGIRMALGATRGDVLRGVVREGLLMCLCGLALGLPAALGGARLLANQLFGVTPADAWSFAAAVLVLIATALAACLAPARRAARVDPAVTLRYE